MGLKLAVDIPIFQKAIQLFQHHLKKIISWLTLATFWKFNLPYMYYCSILHDLCDYIPIPHYLDYNSFNKYEYKIVKVPTFFLLKNLIWSFFASLYFQANF